MKKILRAIVLGASLLVSSPQVTPQDTGISIEIKPGITREEAENKINFLNFSISRLFSSGENRTQKYEEIKKDLLKLLEYSNDRKIQYYANFLTAKITFEKGIVGLYNNPWLEALSETFSSLEKCIFEYPEKEKEFGLAAEALSKISGRFSEAKEKKLIGTSRCYELYNLSSYPQKNSRTLKKNLDDILDTEIGGLHLREALNKMFSPDGVRAFANLGRYDIIHGGDREVYIITPLPEGYGIALSRPATQLKEVVISSEAGIFPKMRMKNLDMDKSKSPFSYYRCEINLTNNIKAKSERYGGYDSLSKRHVEAIKEVSKNWMNELHRQGFIVHEDDIYKYLRYGERVIGFIHPIVVADGVKIRNLLERGGVDPYNWVYKDIKGSQSLKDIKW